MYGGKFHFQINWASLIVGGKLKVFALFYFGFEGNFPSTSSGGGGGGGRFYLEGQFYRGFFCVTTLGRLIFGGACTWKG